MKKFIAAVSTLFIAVALSVVAVAGPASAHSATLTAVAVCNAADGSATVTWTLVNDYNEVLNVTASTNAAIPVGTTVAAIGDGPNTSKTFTQIIAAPAEGKSASATLSFLWSGDNYVPKQPTTVTTGKITGTGCSVPPTKDASAAIVDTAATCTAAETVAEGAVTNATWGKLHITGNNYSAVATAVSGHVFASANGGALSAGNTVDTFTGTLDAQLDGVTCDNTKTTKVTICHVMASKSKPYVSETVSYDSIIPGGHGNAGVNAGDIIPPFNYIKNGVSGAYPGSNWDTAHQAIYNNGCVPPPPPVCIPNSAVSFHYSQNDVNNGYIIVTDVPNSTGALCKPFWVTATSWKFTNNSSVWPQTRDVVDQVGEISAPGTYHFSAPVTCGQGDIYASLDSSAPSLNPGPVLNGPSNPFAEHFLSDMGFTGSATPTYTQDNANCFVPIPETGTPTATVLSCTADSSNSLTLPAVPGGIWTVTSAHYSHAYTIGTGVSGFTPTYFEQYTIVLTDGNSHDGYLVTGNTHYWTPVNPTSLDCNTQTTPATPTAADIVQCGVDGSIWIPTTTGVVYSLDGHVVSGGTISALFGSHTVTAASAPGYEFPAATTSTWAFNLGDETTCTVTTVVGDCTADGSTSSKDVSLVLDNSTSSIASTFEVVIGGNTYGSYAVPANSTVTQSIGSSPTTGETIDVYINGSEVPVVLTVDAFDGCQITAVPGDPSVTQQTCDAATSTLSNDASLTVDLRAGLSYSVTGPNGYALNNLTGTSGQTVVATGLVPGDYVVTVVALPGYILDPTLTGEGSKWPFTITLAPTDCSFGVTATPADCPDTNTDSSAFTATAAGVPSITVQLNSNVVYTAYENGSSTGQVLTAATTDVSAGSWTVKVTLSPTAGPEYKLTGGSVSFGPFNLTAFCPPTLASWHSGASATQAVCTPSGGQDGTITVVHGSDLSHPTDENGKVTYTLVNNTTRQTTSLGSTTSTVTVPPGSYTVKAVPTDPADGLVGNPNAINEIDYTLTIAAAAVLCGDTTTLAFTGGTIAWAGFVLAGGMLFLGLAFLLMRRRQNRIAE